jgi:putative SOS response-associated peptidase YedK
VCGRYTFFTTQDDLEAYFEALVSQQGSVFPNYNVTPGAKMPVVAIGRDKVPVIPIFRWGLIPSWATEASIGYKMINARRETLHEKPAFSRLLERRRCLIPTNGFFEWKPDDKAKEPVYIHQPGNGIMPFAGLWDRWKSPSGEDVFSYSIITTDADESMAHWHHRMPVILPKSRHKDWLDDAISVRDHLDMLLECDTSRILLTPADKRLNKPSENDSGIIPLE